MTCKYLFFTLMLIFYSILPTSLQADPEIMVNPEEIDCELFTGDIEEHTINISNEGDEDLVFTIEHEIIREPDRDLNTRSGRTGQFGPRRDDLGDEIAEYDLGQGEWSGIAWDGELMWGITTQGSMVTYDPDEEEVAEIMRLNGQRIGLACDGEFFWIGTFADDDEQALIQRLDREGDVHRTLNVRGMVVTGVAYDGENLWYYSMNWEPEDMVIRQITTEGEQIREINCGEIFEGSPLSLAWVPEHEGGNLWVIAWNDGRIYQLDISGDEPEVLQEARIDGDEVFGLEHDGENMWYCTMDDVWRVIDDGIREINWLTYEPDEGELEPDAEMEVTVTLNATGLIGGDYEAEMHILSNDPDNDDVIVTVQMNVTSAPVVGIEWDDWVGYPEVIDWNRAYRDLFTGEAYPVVVTIVNVGMAELIVEEITCEENVFNADPDNFSLEPDEEIEVNFILETEEDGLYEAEMVIVCNDPDDEYITIPLRGETSAPPVIVLDPEVIQTDLFTGDVEEHNINVSNVGDSELRFSIEYEVISEPEQDQNTRTARRLNGDETVGPRRDDLGDIIAEFNVGGRGWTGLAWDGEFMWGISDRGNMVAFDPEAEEIVEEVNLNEEYFGMTFDGEFFWVGTSGGDDMRARILRIDRNGDVNRTIEAQGMIVFGITFDGENLWYYGHDFERIVFRQISLNGEQLREVECRGIIEGRTISITWVPEHEDGNLWAIDWEMATIYQLDISEDEPEIVQEAQINRSEQYGLEHDGENMWYSTDNTWHVIDDGVAELSWLSCEPEAGELDPDAEMDVTVIIDAAGLLDGDYEADIHFLSNDPENPDATVRLNMHITGAPVIEVTWDEEAGYPDLIDWNRAYLDLFTGEAYPVPVTIKNIGTADLEVDDILCDEEVFNSEFNEFILGPDEEIVVNFILETAENGVYESEMVIVWNSPAEDDYIVPLAAQTTGPPVIIVDPGEIESNLRAGDTENHAINISNRGEAVLRFTVDCEIIHEPERDENVRLARQLGRDEPVGPRRDDLGDVIDEFNVLRVAWSGLAWDGELMWGITTEAQMAAFDPETEQMVETVNLNGFYYGMAYDGEAFWAGTEGDDERNAMIQRFDRNGDVDRTINVQGFLTLGVAYDGENLWYFSLDFEREDIIIRQITVEGQQLREVNCSRIFDRRNITIAWVPEHSDGNLWAIVWEERRLYQLDVSGDNPEIVQEAQINGSDLYGLEHDSENMWYSTVNGVWYVIDDGIAEVRWLSVDPDEGELDVNYDMDVDVTLNAAELVEGDYEADLHFLSNDPDNRDIIVNVQMHVEPSSVEEETVIPIEFGLSAACPNPFNAVTRIGYAVPELSKVSLKVYDIHGRLLTTLHEGQQTAGEHMTVWDGKNIANGVYFIRMEATGFNAVTKVTLLK